MAEPKRKRVRKEATCERCGKNFSTTDLARHLKTCKEQDDCCYDCPYCHYMGCRSLDNMKTHYQRKHTDQNFKCKKCGWQFTGEGFFDKDHVDNCLKVTRDQVKAAPALQAIVDAEIPNYDEDLIAMPDDDHPVWQEYPEAANEKIREQWWCIRQHFKIGTAVHQYTFRIVGTDIKKFNFGDALRFIYSKEKQAFKFNINSIYMLYKDPDYDDPDLKVEDAVTEYMVFVPQNAQNMAFEDNLLVHDLASLKSALDQVNGVVDKLIDNAERPNTKWVFTGHLAYVFWVYVRSSFMIGRGASNLPKRFTRSKGTVPNEYDKNGHLYTDNLCFFRCLTNFLGRDMHDREEVVSIYEKFRRQVNGPWWDQYGGLQEEHVPIIEDLFEINVKAIGMHPDGSKVLMRKPLNVNRQTLSILLALPK